MKKKKIICKSSNGYIIEFAQSFPFFLEEITGIHEISGKVATVKSAFGVGSKYVGTSINDRPITITGHFRSRLEDRTPQRDILYKAFPLKESGTLYYYEEDIVRKIDYQVESVKTVDKFGFDSFQIDLLCPSPYFTDAEETLVQLSNWNKLLTFPLIIPDGIGIEFGSKSLSLLATIVNLSNIEIGMRIIFRAEGNVVNPSINNVTTGESLKLNQSLKNGDYIEITTYINQKNIYVTIDNETVRKNNTLVFGSKFLQIHHGTNIFKMDADSGLDKLMVELYYYNHYEAV